MSERYSIEWLAEFCRRQDLRFFLDFCPLEARWECRLTSEKGLIGRLIAVGQAHSFQHCMESLLDNMRPVSANYRAS